MWASPLPASSYSYMGSNEDTLKVCVCVCDTMPQMAVMLMLQRVCVDTSDNSRRWRYEKNNEFSSLVSKSQVASDSRWSPLGWRCWTASAITAWRRLNYTGFKGTVADSSFIDYHLVCVGSQCEFYFSLKNYKIDHVMLFVTHYTLLHLYIRNNCEHSAVYCAASLLLFWH